MLLKHPSAIVSPAIEKPITVVPPHSSIKLHHPAAPPDAPLKAKPVTSNWNPAIDPPKSYSISKVPEGFHLMKITAASVTTTYTTVISSKLPA